MTTPFEACLAFTLREEGGFTEDPRDPGGATNRGVTLATLSHWRGCPCTADDVHDLTEAEAGEIYKGAYWSSIRAGSMPAGVDLMVFDFGVNAGPARAARMLQHVLRIPEDGIVGAQTISAATHANPRALITALGAEQSAYYESLPTFPTFGRGWMARLGRRLTTALAMAGPASGKVEAA